MNNKISIPDPLLELDGKYKWIGLSLISEIRPLLLKMPESIIIAIGYKKLNNPIPVTLGKVLGYGGGLFWYELRDEAHNEWPSADRQIQQYWEQTELVSAAKVVLNE